MTIIKRRNGNNVVCLEGDLLGVLAINPGIGHERFCLFSPTVDIKTKVDDLRELHGFAMLTNATTIPNSHSNIMQRFSWDD
jgi:hypothetical protein